MFNHEHEFLQARRYVTWLFREKDRIKRFHPRDQHLCKFFETKGSVYITKEFNSDRICLVHQHGRRFIDLEHQYGRRDVM